MTYEQKEKRLEEILERLDRSETPMDKLASDAREASELIKSMRATLKSAQAEIV
jgi:exodeoxyribonuclease VII small subunit